MNAIDKKTTKKGIFHIVLFLLVMFLTFFAVFHGQDFHQIINAIKQISLPCFLLAILTALFFSCVEGGLIWYLLVSMGNCKSSFLRCISYSFTGFFYSSITPSATGGQPMQLYYMKKDGNSLSESSVALMTVALLYKLVLVIIGCAMIIFWYAPLKTYLQKYFSLYILGLALNSGLVMLLLAVMLMPNQMKKILETSDAFLIKLGIFKHSDQRKEKIYLFINGYRNAERFLILHKGRLCLMAALTLIQRFSVFFLTVLIYYGFSLQGTCFIDILFLQASVYIAVDMLPLPGAQGITELMYCHVFKRVFTSGYLMPSLYITRGINFYFLLFLSLCVEIINQIHRK